MSKTNNGPGGYTVLSFTLEEKEAMVKSGRKFITVKSTIVRLTLEAPAGTYIMTGRDCRVRLFTSADAARRNVKAEFGDVPEIAA